MKRIRVLAVFLFAAAGALATIFGNVRGIVHDPQHRPVPGITVILKARNSEFTQSTQTDSAGEFHFEAVPVGEYTVSVSDATFVTQPQTITVLSGTAPILHLALRLPSEKQTVTVSAEDGQSETVTPSTLVDRLQIQETPGASRSNSLAMITDFVPGAYLTHDQLHLRGGHQVSWLIDGVPIPNTNIASNLGPQIDPKDIAALEVQRGSYSADYGDRTYGTFNVAPRTGFERSNEAELTLSAGNFYQTDDQLNFGGRRDFYQVPFEPVDPNNMPGQFLRDANRESDSFAAFSWVRVLNPGLLLTVSPFFHHNSANYESSAQDFPSSAIQDRASNYAGGQATVSWVAKRNTLRVGLYGFAQEDHQTFGLDCHDLSQSQCQGSTVSEVDNPSGGQVAVYAEEQFKATSWLTLNAGVRQTHFSGGVVENATSPRFGASLRVPKLKWVFRGFYGHFYQAPPLLTVSGPLLQLATSQNLGFAPLHGERDEEHQFGVTIPLRGWTLDADNFLTRASNFFDHNNFNNSEIFIPITIEGARINGWELTLRSPRLHKRGQIYLTYSNQLALGCGGINGGLTDFSFGGGCGLLDHDQRHTLHVGSQLTLPWQAYASTDVYYASGFTNGSQTPMTPGDHLQPHTTFDLTLGKEFGERFSVNLQAINVANRRVLLDNSFTFGGTHFLKPREMLVQLRYRFHY
ncbi:MAG: TonB-dependent receptor [Acidobacteria bacterium]|nr:MAG: TonB-dependent receptor [Acidobacteriota bacterium]